MELRTLALAVLVTTMTLGLSSCSYFNRLTTGLTVQSSSHGSGVDSAAAPQGQDPEESGTQYGLTDRYDHVRAGAHLTMGYYPGPQRFIGTVTNVTQAVLSAARLEGGPHE